MCLLSLGASNHVSDAKSRETQRLLLVSPIRPAFGSILKQNDPWLLKTHIQLVPFFLLLSFFPSLPNPLLFPFHFPVFLSCILDSMNGKPLQYSCLKNHMDRRARVATIHGVAKSRTQLSDWTELNQRNGCMHAKSLQSCPTLCNPMDCSPPGSSVHGLLQARILEWVAMPFSKDLLNPGIEPRSPALQADSFQSEASGKSTLVFRKY